MPSTALGSGLRLNMGFFSLSILPFGLAKGKGGGGMSHVPSCTTAPSVSSG